MKDLQREARTAGPQGAVPGSGSTSRASSALLLRVALPFYGVLFAATLLWAWLAGDSLLYASQEAARRGVDPLLDAGAGVLAGAIVVALSRALTLRTRWGTDLARALGALVGRASLRNCVLLAAVSGVAEEALFRGALQPRIGLVAASLLFGCVHFVPRREFLPWTAFSIAAGFLLGGLFAATGNLVAPTIAHALINAVNLRVLAVRFAPPEEDSTARGGGQPT
ncbi:MAG: type II CAAX endopeptidase family protein [Myxococcota bacterium]